VVFKLHSAHWLYPKLGIIPYDAEKEKASIDEVRVILTGLERQLSKSPYLVGNKIRFVLNIIHPTEDYTALPTLA
jgi:glutathione S-transferase